MKECKRSAEGTFVYISLQMERLSVALLLGEHIHDPAGPGMSWLATSIVFELVCYAHGMEHGNPRLPSSMGSLCTCIDSFTASKLMHGRLVEKDVVGLVNSSIVVVGGVWPG